MANSLIPPPLNDVRNWPHSMQEWMRSLFTTFLPWKAWTVTRTGWTDAGCNVTAYYRAINNIIFFRVTVQPVVTVATTAGVSYFNLPLPALQNIGAGVAQVSDSTTLSPIAGAVLNIATQRCYMPGIGATPDTLLIDGWYAI